MTSHLCMASPILLYKQGIPAGFYARRASTDGEIGTRLNFIYWLRVEKSGGVCDRSVLLQRKVSENTGSIRSRNRRGALQWSAVLLEFEA